MKQPRSPRPPLDAAALEALALGYAARYLTTRARLARYLARKLQERGGPDDAERLIDGLVERAARAGFVDDRAYADARAAGFQRRGYGAGRLSAALRHAGVGAADAAPALDRAMETGWEAALALARRRKLGPFAADPSDPIKRRRGFAAMVRAGHSPGIVARLFGQDPATLED